MYKRQVCKSAEEADALSTALVVLGAEEVPQVAPKFQARLVVFIGEEEIPRIFNVETGRWETS